jgi:perosamine synthetase
MGEVTADFERRLARVLDVPYVTATTSGSMALLMGLLAVGVGPGDEVIVPNRTWIATAHAVLLAGAKPVFVDVERDRPIVDASAIEGALTARTKAIMPVHLCGRSADMEEIHRIAAERGLRVVEDAAQALGSRNSRGTLGSQSDVGCFSLSVAKIISTGQGGFCATRDGAIHERLTLLRTQGVRDVIDASYTGFGFNFRFNDVLAAMGLGQLDRLPGRIEKVVEIYRRYETGLDGLDFLRLVPVDIAAGEVPVYVEVLCDDRPAVMSFLAALGIQTRPFYPDLDLAPHLGPPGDFPNSRVFAEHGLFLPCGPAQAMQAIDEVIESLTSHG